MMKRLNKLLVTASALTGVTLAVLISASAAPAAAGAGTVSCDQLNVRTGPDTGTEITATLQQGDTIVILDQTDGWYHVYAGGTDGYVASSYITDVEAAKNFTATGSIAGSGIRMRSTPSTEGAVLGTYRNGTLMNVIGINNGWYKVTCDGKTGYIRSDYLDLTASGAVTASAEAESAGQEIADFARQFTGSRYIYGAATPGVGFDCSGLTYYVYGKFGYSISRTASQQFRNNGTTVSKANLKPGDLVFFSRNGGRSVTHVGLYIGDGSFVNASTERTGVIISSLSSSWYSKTWYGAKRIID
jgi:cell wall-associated NlpC family hydrolase